MPAKAEIWYTVTVDGAVQTAPNRNEADALYDTAVANGFTQEVSMDKVHRLHKATIGVVSHRTARRQRKVAVGA